MAVAEKQPLSAVKRGKRGAIIGSILIMPILILNIVAGELGPSPIELVLGMVITIGAGTCYGFGYAFGWTWLLRWAAGALHYSGHVLDAGFIWWICTGRKGGIIRGLIFATFLLTFAVTLAWIPGVVKGIKEIRAEKKNEGYTGNRVVNEKKSRKERLFAKKAEKIPAVAEKKEAVAPVQTVTKIPETASAAAVKACYMDCHGGEFDGASFDMRDIRQLAIGRNPQLCRVILNESGISRIHCMVQYRADGMYVQDLSTNGTYLLNGAKLPKGIFVKVQPGDGIRLGKTGPDFRFR